MDECLNATIHQCHQNATCNNNDGGFSCDCNRGYVGNGTYCDGKCSVNLNLSFYLLFEDPYRR